jgi:D-amino peptidase
MNHTVSGRDYQRLWFNGTEVGETGINAALCGTWGCPVLLVTGDQASCDEGRALLGERLTTVAVKQGLGSGSARMIPPVRARELIEAGAKQALQDLSAVAPYDPGSPCEIKVEFKRTQPADRLRFHPGVERLDGRTIRVEAGTWWEAWKLFFFET